MFVFERIMIPRLLASVCLLATLLSVRGQGPSGMGEISGRVVDAVSRRPMGGVMVSLEQLPEESTLVPLNNAGYPYTASWGRVLTGAGGQFSFPRLPRGAFEVIAVKYGWVGGNANQQKWNSPGDVIALTDTQHVPGVVVPLWKAPIVGGRVVDEHDLPRAGITVSALAPSSNAGYQSLESANASGTEWTDDRGRFLITVAPGDYVVCAGLRLTTLSSETPRAAAVSGKPMVYQRTCYDRSARFVIGSYAGTTLRLVSAAIGGTTVGADGFEVRQGANIDRVVLTIRSERQP